MLRALLLLACTAKVAAFAQTPPGCVDVDWGVLQSAYTGDPADSLAMVFEEDSEDVEEVPIAACTDVAAGGGCDDESLAGFCCASCALPQRMTYTENDVCGRRRRRRLIIGVIVHVTPCNSEEARTAVAEVPDVDVIKNTLGASFGPLAPEPSAAYQP